MAAIASLAVASGCSNFKDSLTIAIGGKEYQPRFLYETDEVIGGLTISGGRIFWEETFEANSGGIKHRVMSLEPRHGNRPQVLLGNDAPVFFAVGVDGNVYELDCEGRFWEEPARYLKRVANQAPEDVTKVIWNNVEVRCRGGIYIDGEGYFYALTEEGLQKALPGADPITLVPMEQVLVLVQ